jgi:hypothetical protein
MKVIVNILGTVLILVGVFFFIDSTLKIPVSELTPEGKCLRVLDAEGQNVPNGCKLAKKGKIATEHRYVAK